MEFVTFTSKSDTYFHKECINSIKWVFNDNSYVSSYVLLFLSSFSFRANYHFT